MRSQREQSPYPTAKEIHRWGRRRARAARAEDMYQAYLRGMTLEEVGALYGLGRERVRQLFRIEFLPTRQPGWRPPGDPGRDAYLARRS